MSGGCKTIAAISVPISPGVRRSLAAASAVAANRCTGTPISVSGGCMAKAMIADAEDGIGKATSLGASSVGATGSERRDEAVDGGCIS